MTSPPTRGKDPPLAKNRTEGSQLLAKPELGEKQICPSCGAKFYDLTRRPARCPKCATEFDPEEVVKTRRSRPRSAADDHDEDVRDKPEAEDAEAEVEVEEVDEFGEQGDETPEIDQVDAEEVVADDEDEEAGVETVGKAAADDGLGVDFAEDEDAAEEDDDVPFLEDDEEFDEDEIDGLPAEDEERD